MTLVTTIERSLLVGVESLGKPRTPNERTHFADSVA
jgi:hypothetical protein